MREDNHGCPLFLHQQYNKGHGNSYHVQRGVSKMDQITTTINDAAIETMSNAGPQIEQYTQLIHTYGASAVIIAVFILLLIGIVVYTLKASQKTSNQLLEQQKQLLTALLNFNMKPPAETSKPDEPGNNKPPTEPNLVKQFLNINSSIKGILRDIYDDFNASRTAVYVFHNGVYSSHGLPFFKISCICEIVRKNSGVMKNIDAHNSMPLQMFDNSISYLSKHGHMIVEDADDDENENVKNSPVLCGMLKSNNIKSAVGIALYDKEDNILGILIVEFNEKKNLEYLEGVEKELIEKSPSLSPILEYNMQTEQ